MIKLPDNKLVVATHNQGKRAEIEDLLSAFDIQVLISSDLGLPDPVEDGLTFRANALIKAQAAVDATGLASIGDDSGMIAEGLDGAPGIYSARWAYAPNSTERDFGYAMQQVEIELGKLDNPSRNASFFTCVCFLMPDAEPVYFEGEVKGELVSPIRGADGFGYDPMFQPFLTDGGDGRTFGEMNFAEKQKLSHRARALKKLAEALF